MQDCEQELATGQAKGSLVLITYYGFKEPIKQAARALAKQGWNVYDYSLFRWKHDQFDKTSKYIDNLVSLVVQKRPDAVLFWYFGVTGPEMSTLRSAVDSLGEPLTPFVLFNWNDPYCWIGPERHAIADIAHFFDAAMTCCADSINNYAQNLHQFSAVTRLLSRKNKSPLAAAEAADAGAAESDSSSSADSAGDSEESSTDDGDDDDNEDDGESLVVMQPPGFDCSIADECTRRLSNDQRFKCDVMFACTNLYESADVFPRQRINRRKLLDALDAHPTVNLHLYGPNRFKTLYPRSYQGELAYADTYAAVRTARICINTHVTSHGVQEYMNERTVVVLGCGGLLLTDIAIPQRYCAAQQNQQPDEQFYFTMADGVDAAVQQVVDILSMPEATLQQMRARAGQMASEHLSWTLWGEQMSALLQRTVRHVDNNSSIGRRKARVARLQRVNKDGQRLQSRAATLDSVGGGGGGDGVTELDETEQRRRAKLQSLCTIVQPESGGGGETRLRKYEPKMDFMQKPGALEFDRCAQFCARFGALHESAVDSDSFSEQMSLFIETTRKNPTINVDLLLDNYWRNKDCFH